MEDLFMNIWDDIPLSAALSSSQSLLPLSSSLSSFPLSSLSSSNPAELIPSVPSTSFSESPQLSKKRKGIDNEEENNTSDNNNNTPLWSPYAFGPKLHPVLEIGTYEQVSQNMNVGAKIINSNFTFSENDCAWICYKQNQFKVICVYQGPQADKLVLNDDGVLKKVDEVCVSLYAVKEVAGVLGDGMRVGIHRVGKKRLKSAKQDIEITPFSHGSVTFSNLSFEKSNAVKRPHQTEFFHLVIALYAKCGDNTFHVLSKISPKIIVRGQNPGFYKEEANIDCKESIPQVVTKQEPVSSPETIIFDPNSSSSCSSSLSHHTPSSSRSTPSPQSVHSTTNSPSPSVSSAIITPPPFVNPSPVNKGSSSSTTSINATHTINTINAINTNRTTISPSQLTVPPVSTPTVHFNPPTQQQDINNYNNSSFSRPSTTPQQKQDDYSQYFSNPNNLSNLSNFPNFNHANSNSNFSNFNSSNSNWEEGLKKRLGAEFLVHNGENGWKKIGDDTVYHNGRVGINTAIPVEALTINGNMLVSGQLYKPSDMRIKSQISPVSYQEQLDCVRKLQIYDYQVQNHLERGVIAQELAVVKPSAVHGVGDVEIGGVTIPNLLVVNERSLLYENIGATKQLDQNLIFEKENIVHVTSNLEEIKENTDKDNNTVKAWVQSIMNSLFYEEHRKKVMYAGLEEEFFNFQFSVFKMGPARSLFVLGHFAAWMWVLGSLFMCSNVKARKYLGFMCFARFVFNSLLNAAVDQGPYFWGKYYNGILILDMVNILMCYGFGFIALILNYRRIKGKIKYPDHPEPAAPTTRLGRAWQAACSCLFY